MHRSVFCELLRRNGVATIASLCWSFICIYYIIEWASAQVPPTPLIVGGVLQRERGRRTARQTYGRLLLKQREVAPCGQMDTEQLELRQARKGEAVAVLAT